MLFVEILGDAFVTFRVFSTLEVTLVALHLSVDLEPLPEPGETEESLEVA